MTVSGLSLISPSGVATVRDQGEMARSDLGPIKATPQRESSPAATTEWLAWNEWDPDARKKVIYYEDRLSGKKTKLGPGLVGGIFGDSLYFTETGTGDIYVHHLRGLILPPTRAVAQVNTSDTERDPSASDRGVLYVRHREGEKQLLLWDSFTRNTTILSSVESSAGLRVGQMTGEWATWTECTETCTVHLANVVDGSHEVLPAVAAKSYAPAVNGVGTVWFATSQVGCGKSVRFMEYSDGTLTKVADVPTGSDVRKSVVYANADGGFTIAFDRKRCGGKQSDIYEFHSEAPPSVAGDPYARSTTVQVNPAHEGFVSNSSLSPPLTTAWTATWPPQGGYRVEVSYPVIGDDAVYVALSGSPTGDPPRLVALNKTDGSVRWSRNLPRFIQGLAYDNDRVFVVRTAGQDLDDQTFLQAFAADTGTEIWKRWFSGKWASVSPVPYDHLIYASDGTQAAFSQADGSRVWATEAFGEDTPAVDEERVYSAPGDKAISVDRLTGEVAWKKSTANIGTHGQVSAVHDSRLFGWDSGDRFVYEANTGTFLYSLGPSSQYLAFGGPDGSLGVLTDGAAAIGFDPHSGTVVWTNELDNEYSSATSPLIVGETVYIGERGSIFGLDLLTGATVWHEELPNAPLGAVTNSGLGADESRLYVPFLGGLRAFESEG